MMGATGPPNYSTDILGTFFYRTAIAGEHPVARPDMGIGAAVATITFLILMVGVRAGWSISRRRAGRSARMIDVLTWHCRKQHSDRVDRILRGRDRRIDHAAFLRPALPRMSSWTPGSGRLWGCWWRSSSARRCWTAGSAADRAGGVGRRDGGVLADRAARHHAARARPNGLLDSTLRRIPL